MRRETWNIKSKLILTKWHSSTTLLWCSQSPKHGRCMLQLRRNKPDEPRQEFFSFKFNEVADDKRLDCNIFSHCRCSLVYHATYDCMQAEWTEHSSDVLPCAIHKHKPVLHGSREIFSRFLRLFFRSLLSGQRNEMPATSRNHGQREKVKVDTDLKAFLALHCTLNRHENEFLLPERLGFWWDLSWMSRRISNARKVSSRFTNQAPGMLNTDLRTIEVSTHYDRLNFVLKSWEHTAIVDLRITQFASNPIKTLEKFIHS